MRTKTQRNQRAPHAKTYAERDMCDPRHVFGTFKAANDAQAAFHAETQLGNTNEYVGLYRVNVWFGMRADRFLGLVPTRAPRTGN